MTKYAIQLTWKDGKDNKAMLGGGSGLDEEMDGDAISEEMTSALQSIYEEALLELIEGGLQSDVDCKVDRLLQFIRAYPMSKESPALKKFVLDLCKGCEPFVDARFLCAMISFDCPYMLSLQDDLANDLCHHCVAHSFTEGLYALTNAHPDEERRQEMKNGCLLLAARRGNYRMVSYCLLDGASPNARLNYDSKPSVLMEACRSRGDCTQKIVNRLLGAGADPNLTDDTKHTALMSVRHRPTALLLIQKGADVNAVDRWNRSVLMHHVGVSLLQEKCSECAMLLLDHGADPTVTDDDGVSAIQLLDRPISKGCQVATEVKYRIQII